MARQSQVGQQPDSFLRKTLEAGDIELMRVNLSDGVAAGDFWLNFLFNPEPGSGAACAVAYAALLLIRGSRDSASRRRS